MLVRSSIRPAFSFRPLTCRQNSILHHHIVHHLSAPPKSFKSFSIASNKMSSAKIILSPNACPPLGPYSQAIVAGNTIYVSGQIPADVKGELIQGTITEKTRACAMSIKAILEEAGASLAHIVKCNVFLDDMANFAEMNAEYEKHFSHKPARSCVAVKQLPKGVPVEIECIAVV